MRHIILFVSLFLCLGAQAQTGKAANRVAEIRRIYNETKQHIAEVSQEENARNELTVNSHHMVPACGITEEVIHYYIDLQDTETPGEFHYQPYFITRSYNIAARKFYEEFLYDRNTNELIFVYLSGDNYETGGRDETRYYWGNPPEGLVYENVKGERTMDEVFASRLANDLMEAFHHLRNREY